MEAQAEAARKTCSKIVKLVQQGNRVVIAHGNGPQVGFILRRSEISRNMIHTVPLDSCVADTEGAIGYHLQIGMYNEFMRIGLEIPVVTLVTQVLVSADDPAFQNPTKPIGEFMTKESAEERQKNEGWNIVEDAGRGYRRVVPSPKPLRIIEEMAIRRCIEQGVIVIAAGGGGIPVVEKQGFLVPKEAVIDKDFAAGLLAKTIEADMMIISTAVDKVYLNYNKPDQRGIDSANPGRAGRTDCPGTLRSGKHASQDPGPEGFHRNYRKNRNNYRPRTT